MFSPIPIFLVQYIFTRTIVLVLNQSERTGFGFHKN